MSSVHSNDGKNVSNKKFDRLYFVLSNFLHYEKLNLCLNVDECSMRSVPAALTVEARERMAGGRL